MKGVGEFHSISSLRSAPQLEDEQNRRQDNIKLKHQELLYYLDETLPVLVSTNAQTNHHPVAFNATVLEWDCVKKDDVLSLKLKFTT